MDLPANFSKCVCFLCVLQNGKYVPKGTCFFIAIPYDAAGVTGSHLYLVTAKHCIEKAQSQGALYARLNSADGFRIVELNEEWTYPDAAGSDVAVLPFNKFCQASDEIHAVPITMLATNDILRDKRIGLGDNVVVVGLFSKHHGNKKNIPIIRAGVISAMPGEPLIGSDGAEYKAYLVEMHSGLVVLHFL